MYIKLSLVIMGDKRGNSWTEEELLESLRGMDEFEFENLIADLWEAQGWETEVEQQTGDAGIDVRGRKTSPYDRKVLIQAKRYGESNSVGSPAIQQYSALKRQEPDADEVIVVATSHFTDSAQDRASELNVKLIDGDQLVELIERNEAYDVVEEYIEPPDNLLDLSQEEPKENLSDSAELNPEIDISQYIDKGIDEILREEEYRVVRANERSKGKVRLNPHDAEKLGIFQGLPEELTESWFRETKRERALLKEDLHLNENGDIFVEDLTGYISGEAIEESASENIIGVIERGVKDLSWATPAGKKEFEQLQSRRRIKKAATKAGQGLSSKFSEWVKETVNEDTADANSATQQAEPAHTEQIKKQEHNSEATTQEPSSDKTQEQKGDAGKISRSPQSTENRDETADSSSSNNARSTSGDSEIDQQSKQSATTSVDSSSVQRDTNEGTASGNIKQPIETTEIWKTVITAAILLVPLSFVMIGIGVDAVGGLFYLGGYVLLPLGIVQDIRKLSLFSEAKIETIGYILGSLIPFFGTLIGIVYLYRRRRAAWFE